MPPVLSSSRRISWLICSRFSGRQLHTPACLLSRPLKRFGVHEEGAMQSTQIEEIKAALWEQAFHGCTQAKCPPGPGTAARHRKGLLVALLRGRGRRYPVEAVTIERPPVCQTGACDLEDATG